MNSEYYNNLAAKRLVEKKTNNNVKMFWYYVSKALYNRVKFEQPFYKLFKSI
jgi:hypothetical protein